MEVELERSLMVVDMRWGGRETEKKKPLVLEEKRRGRDADHQAVAGQDGHDGRDPTREGPATESARPGRMAGQGQPSSLERPAIEPAMMAGAPPERGRPRSRPDRGMAGQPIPGALTPFFPFF